MTKVSEWMKMVDGRFDENNEDDLSVRQDSPQQGSVDNPIVVDDDEEMGSDSGSTI